MGRASPLPSAPKPAIVRRNGKGRPDLPRELPILDRIYWWPEYTAVARAIGYRGVLYRDLWPIIEELAKQFDKVKVESAIYYLCTFEGQMRCNPPPLARVMFREEVRPLMWQLLGPAPEQEDAFWRYPDGTPMERPKKDQSFTEKVVEPEKKGRKPRAR
jgi:hypothetical protein